MFQFDRVITQSPRITQNSETSIDVSLTKFPEKTGVLYVGISDHSPTYICQKISFAKAQSKIIESRNQKNYNFDHFNKDLDNLLKEYNWENNHPDVLWGQFKYAFNKTADIQCTCSPKNKKR